MKTNFPAPGEPTPLLIHIEALSEMPGASPHVDAVCEEIVGLREQIRALTEALEQKKVQP